MKSSSVNLQDILQNEQQFLEDEIIDGTCATDADIDIDTNSAKALEVLISSNENENENEETTQSSYDWTCSCNDLNPKEMRKHYHASNVWMEVLYRHVEVF